MFINKSHIENSVEAAGVDDRKYENSEDCEDVSDGINYPVFPNNQRCWFMVGAFDPAHYKKISLNNNYEIIRPRHKLPQLPEPT